MLLAAGAVIAALLAGYVVGLRTDPVEMTTAAKAHSFGSTTRQRRHSSPRISVASPSIARSGQPANQAPLPAKDAPVARIYDALAARAQAGDAAAAMRLFSDLQRCQGRSVALTLFEGIAKNIDGLPVSAVKETQRRMLDRFDATDALCADITDAQLDARGEWLRNAALAGDAEAMVCYAMSPGDFGPRFMSDAWIDWAERWHEEAPGFAAQAFAAGQADVIDLFLDAYDTGTVFDDQRMTTHPLGGLFSPNQELAYAFSLISTSVVPAKYVARAQIRSADLRTKLSAEQIARAQAFADEAIPRFAAQAGNSANVFPCRDVLHSSLPW